MSLCCSVFVYTGYKSSLYSYFLNFVNQFIHSFERFLFCLLVRWIVRSFMYIHLLL